MKIDYWKRIQEEGAHAPPGEKTRFLRGEDVLGLGTGLPSRPFLPGQALSRIMKNMAGCGFAPVDALPIS